MNEGRKEGFHQGNPNNRCNGNIRDSLEAKVIWELVSIELIHSSLDASF